MIKCNYGDTKIASNQPEHLWHVNGVRKLLKKIDKTVDIAQKGFGRPKSVSTNENIELVEKLILG